MWGKDIKMYKKQKAPKVLITTLYFTKARCNDGKFRQVEPEYDTMHWQEGFYQNSSHHKQRALESRLELHENWVQERIACGTKRSDLPTVDYYTQKVVSA